MHPIKQHASDPYMNDIAKALASITWQTPLDADELSAANAVLLEPRAPKRLVVLMPNYITYAVRMYLGGAQRTFGFTKDGVVALRFSDMVRTFFWTYRVRGAHEPTEGELNFSVDRVRADLQYEPEVVALLKSIETYLLGCGAINTSADRERAITEGRESKRRQRTVTGTILEMNDVWLARFQALEEKVDQLLARPQTVYTPPFINTPGGLPVYPDAQPGWPLPPQPYCQPGTGSPMPPNPVTVCRVGP